MRIVAGRNRGRQLAEPADRAIRPSSDRLREAVFNIIGHPGASWAGAQQAPLPQGARVLDVFAGTGAMGLEAVSRGAAHVALIERDGAALKLIHDNIRRLNATALTTVIGRDATDPGKPPAALGPADLVFIDPPYGQGLIEAALARLLPLGWIAPTALIVAEHDSRESLTLPAGLTAIDSRRYGKGAVTLLTAG